VLFCTDFSQNADFAFNYAVDAVIKRPSSELYLLHVIPESDSQFWKTYIYDVEDIDNKAKHDIDTRIKEAYIDKQKGRRKIVVNLFLGVPLVVIIIMIVIKIVE
jgi:hypothetical protein